MPSTRSEASYNHSSSSQKGYRHDYDRSQSATGGQGSVNEAQSDKLCHSEGDNTVLPSNRADNTTRSLCGHIKTKQEYLKNAFQQKEYQILADLWKKCMSYHLTVRTFLGHPKIFRLLNGWNPFIERNK
ncbi:hypothetical protein O181_110391 [Austropuccinia psidii MF-1]|uniref:Uncharacterized protein n=1 Tax=Austropuccinia psidii MF-1 TaxID=1389203 RepID=A0A9Q3JYI4_9BASI|nr:hypothetical protein [Austropuccinia psidii MF-1]